MASNMNNGNNKRNTGMTGKAFHRNGTAEQQIGESTRVNFRTQRNNGFKSSDREANGNGKPFDGQQRKRIEYAQSHHINGGETIGIQIRRRIKALHEEHGLKPGDDHLVHATVTQAGHINLKYNNQELCNQVLDTPVPVSSQPYVIEIKSKVEHIRVNRFMSKKDKDTGRFVEIDNKSVSSDEHPSLFVKCRYDGKDFSLVFFTTIRNFSRRLTTYVEEAMDHIYNAITAPETYLDDNGEEVKLYINLSDVIRESINQPMTAPQRTSQEHSSAIDSKPAVNAFDALDVEDPDAQARALAEPKQKPINKKKGAEPRYKPLPPRAQDLKPVIDSQDMDAFPTLGGGKPSTNDFPTLGGHASTDAFPTLGGGKPSTDAFPTLGGHASTNDFPTLGGHASTDAFPTLGGGKPSTDAKQLEQRVVQSYSKMAAMQAIPAPVVTVPKRNAGRKVSFDEEEEEYPEEDEADEYLPVSSSSKIDYFDADF